MYILKPNAPTPNNSATVFAKAALATITKAATINNSGRFGEGVKFTNTVSNVTNYQTFSVVTTIPNANYFNTSTPVSSTSNCSYSLSGNNIIQTCVFNPSTTTGYITYAVDPQYFQSNSGSVTASYNLSTSGQAVSLNSSTLTVTIPQIFVPNIVFSTPATSMSIVGNSIASATQVINITNSGGTDAYINNISIGAASAYFRLPSSCDNGVTDLVSGDSCSITIQLGPYYATQALSSNAILGIDYMDDASNVFHVIESVPYQINIP